MEHKALTRAWRLGLLLTGEAGLAQTVVVRAVARARSFSITPRHRRDRLVILEARRIGPAPVARPRLAERLRAWRQRVRGEHREARGDAQAAPPETHEPDPSPFSPLAKRAVDALQTLPPQWREAWILRDLDMMNEMDASKSMDCSRSALARHVHQAEEIMRTALGENFDEAVAALREESQHVTPVEMALSPRATLGNRHVWLVLAWLVVIAFVVFGVALIVRAVA